MAGKEFMLNKRDKTSKGISLLHTNNPRFMETAGELHQYLHRTILSNIRFYKALAKYQQLASYLPHNVRDHKNHRLILRLTGSGLSLFQTQFAKKPKNPV